MALVIWMAAMMIDTGSDRAAVQARYAEQLDRQITAVSVRHGWHDDGSDVETIAEQIRSRITCQPIPVHKFAQNGVCDFSVQCSNAIARTRRVVREFSVTMPDPGPTVLCTIDPNVVLLDERQVEDDDPAIIMLGLFEEMLRSIDASGHLPADPFIGTFPAWTAAFVGMYGVDRDLDMDYFARSCRATTGAGPNPSGSAPAGASTRSCTAARALSSRSSPTETGCGTGTKGRSTRRRPTTGPAEPNRTVGHERSCADEMDALRERLRHRLRDRPLRRVEARSLWATSSGTA